MDPPRILVTLTHPASARDPAVQEVKNARYLDALRRHWAEPLAVDARTPAADRAAAFAAAQGLLITGGADVDPAAYGEAPHGSGPTDPGRDALDRAAFDAATDRGMPVLGICRGLQAINVFSGGAVVQHLEHHESPPYPSHAAEATRHPLHLVPGTRLAALLNVRSLAVNSFHHQAVDTRRLAAGLRAAGLTPYNGGELVEALESEQPDRWLFAVQCHPERSETSPPELEGLWSAFVDAARTTVGADG
jgi:putative glutamine amidotransferase